MVLYGATAYSAMIVAREFLTSFLNKKVWVMKKNQIFFLIAAFASFVLSVSLWFLGEPEIAKEQGIFVGLWVPSILALGGYFNG